MRNKLKLIFQILVVLLGIGESSAFLPFLGALAAGTAVNMLSHRRVPVSVGVNMGTDGTIRSAVMTAGSTWDSRSLFRMEIPVNGYHGSGHPEGNYHGGGDTFKDAIEYARTASTTFTVNDSGSWEYSVQMLNGKELHRARNEDSGRELIKAAGKKSIISDYNTPYRSFSYFTPENDDAAIAMKSFVFEETILDWKFGIEWFNGKEYHRAWTTDGSDDMLVPAGQVWHIAAGSNRPDRASSRQSRWQDKQTTCRERESSPPPVDTELRRLGRGLNEIYNQSTKYIIDSIPEGVKEGYSVCVEYVEKYTPEKVKTCVNATLNKLSNVLDGLDKGAEITSAGVRRLLRDELGVAQATAQDVSDVMRAGTQIAISLMPSKAVSIARSLPKVEIVRLAPSGTRGSTYRFAFKDGGSTRTMFPGSTRKQWHLLDHAEKIKIQGAFVNRNVEKGVWKKEHKINGREAWKDLRKKNVYYTKDSRHCDIEVWRVNGKTAHHQGSMEPIDGTIYKKPNHDPQLFE